MMDLEFVITRYVDDTYRINPTHMHHESRDDLNRDDVLCEDLPALMLKITEICKKEDIKAHFTIR